MAKKSAYPKIEQTVTIGQVTIGDNTGVKFKGLDFTPDQAKQLATWHAEKAEIKMTLQQTQGELFEKDEKHPMEK